MKNLTNVLLGLVLVLGANQLLAQDAGSGVEPQKELAEVAAARPGENAHYSYVAPNEMDSNTTSGCWSDYLRQLYQEDAATYTADLLATREMDQ